MLRGESGYSLHDCIATGISLDNSTLSFYFPNGIVMGNLAPKGRHIPYWHSSPTKLSFIGADLRFFHVYENWDVDKGILNSNVTCYELNEIIEMVSNGKWKIEFVYEYRTYKAMLYDCCLIEKNGDNISRRQLYFALDAEQILLEWNDDDIPEMGVDLFADNLRFLGNTEEERQYDFCLHGNVTLRIDGRLAVDSVKCCVTASALRFLRSLFTDHRAGDDEEFFFPCCGNMLIPSENGRSVTIIGCPNGTDISIERKCNLVYIVAGQIDQYVPYEEYKSSVLAFAKQILRFLQNSPERKFESEADEMGFKAFMNEYLSLIDNARCDS